MIESLDYIPSDMEVFLFEVFDDFVDETLDMDVVSAEYMQVYYNGALIADYRVDLSFGYLYYERV